MSMTTQRTAMTTPTTNKQATTNLLCNLTVKVADEAGAPAGALLPSRVFPAIGTSPTNTTMETVHLVTVALEIRWVGLWNQQAPARCKALLVLRLNLVLLGFALYQILKIPLDCTFVLLGMLIDKVEATTNAASEAGELRNFTTTSQDFLIHFKMTQLH